MPLLSLAVWPAGGASSSLVLLDRVRVRVAPCELQEALDREGRCHCLGARMQLTKRGYMVGGVHYARPPPFRSCRSAAGWLDAGVPDGRLVPGHGVARRGGGGVGHHQLVAGDLGGEVADVPLRAELCPGGTVLHIGAALCSAVKAVSMTAAPTWWHSANMVHTPGIARRPVNPLGHSRLREGSRVRSGYTLEGSPGGCPSTPWLLAGRLLGCRTLAPAADLWVGGVGGPWG